MFLEESRREELSRTCRLYFFILYEKGNFIDFAWSVQLCSAMGWHTVQGATNLTHPTLWISCDVQQCYKKLKYKMNNRGADKNLLIKVALKCGMTLLECVHIRSRFTIVLHGVEYQHVSMI